jgi:transposase-like protein
MANKPRTDLRSAIYHDDNAAREHLERVLWPHGPVCPRCGVMGDRITKLAGTSTRPGVYKCKDCRKPFTVTVGTVFERSHIPLSKWLMATHLMAASKKGFSAHELHRVMNVSYEAAWFMFHRLRAAADEVEETGPLGGNGGAVEIDEAYIGGKEGNKHASKRKNVRGGVKGKMAVVSLVERDGHTKSFHIANVNWRTLRPILVKHVHRDTHLMSDEAQIYPALARDFDRHSAVSHKAEEYVRDDIHTNTVESHFALLKRGIYGTFHSISEAHLHRYLAEFDFRANTRDLSDGERAAALLANAKGKRLLYRQPNEAANG